jgi:type II secretory pathway component PulK
MKTVFPLPLIKLFLGLALIQGLEAAPLPHKLYPDAGLIAAPHSLSNYLDEGILAGSFEDLYPGIYPGYGWISEVQGIGTNGLFQVDYVVFDENRAGNNQHLDHGATLSVLLFRPLSKPGSASLGWVAPWSLPTVHSASASRGPGHLSPAQSALLAVSDALLGAQFFVANARHYLFLSDSESLTFTGQLPASFPGVGSVGAQELRRVRVGLRSDLNGKTDLILEHVPLFIHLAGDGAAPFRITLATDVSTFQLRYPVPTTGTVLDSWPWTNQLPQLVQLTLGLGKPHGLTAPDHLASRIFLLPAVSVTPDLQEKPAFPPSPGGGPTNVPPQRRGAPSVEGEAAHSVAEVQLQSNAGEAAPIAQSIPWTESQPRKAAASDLELEWLARSGVELAKYVLALEAVGPFRGDSLKQRWAGGPGEPGSIAAQIPLENLRLGAGTISLKIVDLDRRFNLNVADEVILWQALTLAGAQPMQFQPVVDSILDWRDADDLPLAAGAESAYYQTFDPAYSPRNGPFDDLSELLWVKGMNPEWFYGAGLNGEISDVGLEDLFTVISSTRININTASSHVLQLFPAIDENIAQTIIQARAGPDGLDGTADDIPFRHPFEIPGRIPGFVNWADLNHFSVRSFIFEVSVKVELHENTAAYVAWLLRTDARLVLLLKMRRL